MTENPHGVALPGFARMYGPIVLFALVLPAWPFYTDTGTSTAMWTYAGMSVAPVFVVLTALLVAGLFMSVWVPRSMTGVAIGFVAAVLLVLCVPFAWRFDEGVLTSAGYGAVTVYGLAVLLTGVHGLVLMVFRSRSRTS
jgi:hypothetical protein